LLRDLLAKVEMRRMTKQRHPGFEAHAERIATLVEEINKALGAGDFNRLANLGNRLATDGVIADALRGRRPNWQALRPGG